MLNQFTLAIASYFPMNFLCHVCQCFCSACLASDEINCCGASFWLSVSTVHSSFLGELLGEPLECEPPSFSSTAASSLATSTYSSSCCSLGSSSTDFSFSASTSSFSSLSTSSFSS